MKEIHSQTEMMELLESELPLSCVVVQGLDLRPFSAKLLNRSAEGATFLGCQIESIALDHVLKTGGLVFPTLPNLPFEPYRPQLYNVDELMEGYKIGKEGSFYSDTRDSKIYDHYQASRRSDTPAPIIETLAQRLHDHAIDDAMELQLRGKKGVVAIMGGHALKRSDPYFNTVANLAYRLSKKGFYLVTGGGPGAMEAGNLGAWLSATDSIENVGRAIEILSNNSDYRMGAYLDLALEVKDIFNGGADSLAIPTWFYGHEPSNLFATNVAKYFSNSLREDGLLAIATGGVIYSPGSAGTVQEVFMDAAQNHYGTFKLVSPMVFLGSDFWSEKLPVLPLLEKLSEGKQYADMIMVTDEVDEIVHFFETTKPQTYSKS